MSTLKTTNSIGVMFGNFQVPALNDEMKNAITSVSNMSSKLIILVTVGNVPSSNNPLDYYSRHAMLSSFLKTLNVASCILPVKDHHYSDIFTRNVDLMISLVSTPRDTVKIYCEKGLPLDFYSGNHLKVNLVGNLTSPVIQQDNPAYSNDFRAGIIYGKGLEYPMVLPTVDAAIYNPKTECYAMAFKLGCSKYRFVGGFSDISSKSYEEDVLREVGEETGHLGVDPLSLEYIGSTLVDDVRYKNVPDRKIKTLFFHLNYQFGNLTATDDIVELKWIHWSQVKTKLEVEDVHHPLVDLLREYRNKKG